MFELIFSFVGEFLVQVVVELLVELGLHAMAEPLRRPANPWLAAIGYGLLGFIVGGLSLLVFPANFVPSPWRLANLIVTPLIIGGLMVVVGAWRARRGEALWRIDRFACGFLFAFAIALVRFQFGV
jgi:hypothetical protein